MKNNIIKNVFQSYLKMFIFLSINREYLFFSIDLRYLMLPMGAFLVLFGITNIKKGMKDRLGIGLILFFIIIFASVIHIFISNSQFNLPKLVNELILYINNFIALVVFILYKDNIKFFEVKRILFISILVLFISQVLVLCNLIPDLFIGGLGYYTGPEHWNLFGGNFRYAGFAYDPNYASFFFAIAIFILLFDKKENLFQRCFFIIVCILGLSLSNSRTVMLALLISIIFYYIHPYLLKLKKKTQKKFVMKLICALIPISFFLMVYILSQVDMSRFFELSTMTTRLNMWECAKELFMQNPLIGSGLTSFRNYFQLNGHWYVQSHSTYWQILSELGILGAASFSYVCYICFYYKGRIVSSILVMFLILGATSELCSLSIFIIIAYIIPSIYDIDKRSNNVLFVVNSFGQGGAERVCLNLADGFANQGYKVQIITLYKEKAYDLDYRFTKLSLDIEKKCPKYKKLWLILIGSIRVDLFLKRNIDENGEYILVTSHLPMSNLLSFISVLRTQTLYVMHTLISVYVKKTKTIKCVFKLMMKKLTIVSVSDGIKNELVNIYDFNRETVHTVYNPIDIGKISILKNEINNFNDNYFLFVGRLSEVKRLDRLFDIYISGAFYENYKLVIVGDGEEKDKYIEVAKNNNLEDRICFVGWQSNVYKWMANASILLLVSDYEAFPMVIIEALSCGCRVVASDYLNYGPKEILVDDFKEFLVSDINNIAKYVNTINKALNNYPETTKNRILLNCAVDRVINEYLFLRK